MKQEIKPINKRISTYRKLAGYTQQTAAEALGMKKNTYARMELHGNPTPDILVRLAALFNVSPNLILFGSDGGETSISQQKPPETRLNEPPQIFARGHELALSTNEKNCIKAVRAFTKDEQKQVMELINKIYKSKQKGNG